MPRGGSRPGSGRKPAPSRRIPHSVGLTSAELERWRAVFYRDETLAEYIREAGDLLAETRRRSQKEG